jgi:hypothetical protein
LPQKLRILRECEEHQEAKARWDAQRAAALAQVEQMGTSFDQGIGRSKEKIQLANQALKRLDSDSRALEQKLNQLEKLALRHNAGNLWLISDRNVSGTRSPGVTRFSYDEHAQRSAVSSPKPASNVAGPPAPLPADRVSGLNYHVGPPVRHDGATAQQNLQGAAAGQPVQRSNYANAPGGSVSVNQRMQDAMSTLARDYTFRVTEMAGGSHNTSSRHYLGNAIDVDRINGTPINAQTVNNPVIRQFRSRAEAMGATVIGPGDDPNHNTHFHVQWPSQPIAPSTTPQP